jgi:hypothetical protein
MSISQPLNNQQLLPVISKEIYQMALAIVNDTPCFLCEDLAFLMCIACEKWVCEEHIGFQQPGYVLCSKCCAKVES